MSALLELGPDLRSLRGEVTLDVRNTSSKPLVQLPLLAFPNRLSSPHPKINEVNMDWLFPGGFSAGGMEVDRITAQGEELKQEARPGSGGTIIDVALPRPLPVGAALRLRVFFRVRVPERFGPFGVANEQLTLDGGSVPRLPRLGSDGFVVDSPVDTTAFDVSVRWKGARSRRGVVIVNGRVASIRQGQPYQKVATGTATRITLTLLTRYELSTLKVGQTHIAFYHRRPRRKIEPRGQEVRDVAAIDTHAQSLGTVGAGLRMFERWVEQLGLSTVPRKRFVMVECGLRRDLAIAAPGMLLVSDRAFEIVEVDRLQKFQRLAILRALFRVVIDELTGRKHPPRLRGRVVDMLAVDAALRWEHAVYGRADSVEEMLAGGSFVALVDEALYAPQLPFQTVYFAVPDDTDRLRDRFTLFNHDLSNGRRWLAKLRDGTARAKGALNAMLEELWRGRTLDTALETLDGFSRRDLEQWDRRYAKMNYALTHVSADRDDRGWYADITVERRGSQVVEPVTIRVTSVDGRASVDRWNGKGRVGTVRVRTSARPDKVLIDPDNRLAESDLGQNIDPRRDNRNYDMWKFLVEGVSLAFSSATGRLETSIVAFLQPKNDLSHLLVLEPYFLANRLGVYAGYAFYFGDKVRANRRRYSISAALRAEWLQATEQESNGLGLNLSVGFGDLRQLSKINPAQSQRFYASLSAGLAYQDEAVDYYGQARVGYARVGAVADGHRLGFRLEAATTVGGARLQQKVSLGGVGGVRAFDPLGQVGNHRILLQSEWRHRLSRDMLLNVAQLGFVTRVDGVFHADVALLSDSYDGLFSTDAVYVGVGYGFRFYYLLFGVNPMLVSLDLSVPVFVGTPLRVNPTLPASVVLSIDQTF